MTKTNAPPSRLRARRLMLGLTLDDISRALKKDGARCHAIASVAEWEKNRRPVPPDVVPALCRALGLRRLP